jgi:hypothetical protein
MRRLLFVIALCLTARFGIAEEAQLTKDQMRQFLINAKVVSSKQTSKGVTLPYRLTLTDGTITHEAVFQSIDEHKSSMQFADGHTEINFVDSYKYNVAAYVLAEMLEADDMIPIYVERKWNGKIGSLSWLVPVQMDEQDRMKKKVSAPNTDSWNRQMYRVRVFNELVYDTDANLTNVLVGENWKIWRVDFSRAFRLSKDIKDPKNLVKCDRQLLEKLKTLDGNELRQKTKNLLTPLEVEALMARRDKIVAFFQKLAKEKGETEVLY